MGKVLMIGGSPMTGKSTAAAAMGSVRRWPCLSTDDVGEVLAGRAAVGSYAGDGLSGLLRLRTGGRPDRGYPAVPPCHGAGARTARRYPQHLGRAARAGGLGPLSRPCPALARRVGFRDLARRRGGLLESRLRRRPGFLDGAAAENYLRRSKWHNRRLLEECRALALPFLQVREGDTPAEIAGRLEALLPSGF